MKNCLLTKDFLTKRRHQRRTTAAVYNVGEKLQLIFGQNNPNIEQKRMLVRLSSSVPSAFGTGNLHPTTLWCIEMLEKYIAGSSLLDVGAGAAILTICALRLLDKEKYELNSSKIDAFDIYQDAIKQAKTNLRLNGLEKYVNLRVATLADYPDRFYSTVIANLPPIAISELLTQLIEKVRVHGRLILSGILRHNFSNIEQKLTSKGFKIIDQKITDLWCLIVVERE